MTERTIKVFLASSDELQLDRLEFGDLVTRLNNIYRNRGIYIELLKWGNLDASISDVRKQSDYNGVVINSDLFLALFHTKAGKYTLEEFDAAFDAFKQSKEKPKIYTYFRELVSGQTEEAALIDFKNKLQDEMGHYYCRYGNTEKMMLEFVLQIKILNLDNAPEVKVEESRITIDNQDVIDLTKIPFINKNKYYLKFKDQIDGLEKQYLVAFERSRKYSNDPSFLAEMIRISEEKENLKKELYDLEKNMIGLAEKLLELSAQSVTSTRLRQAQECFENGDVAGANAILNAQEITNDVKRLEEAIMSKI
jgi:hypothetical protein